MSKKQIETIKIIQQRYSKLADEDSGHSFFTSLYDQYITHYNKADNKISILAELYTIQNAIEERRGWIDEESLSTFKYVFTPYRSSENITEAKERLNSQQLEQLHHYEIGRTIMEQLKRHLVNRHPSKEHLRELSDLIIKFFKIRGEADESERYVHKIYRLAWSKTEKHRARNHSMALRMAIDRIIEYNYPTELSYWGNLSEEDKKEHKKLGAPLNDDVSQSEVESIVNQLLEKHEDGKVIESQYGEKKQYFIIHENGKWGGRANINQIFKYFEDLYPELINISPRQFQERIKKALPEDMK